MIERHKSRILTPVALFVTCGVGLWLLYNQLSAPVTTTTSGRAAASASMSDVRAVATQVSYVMPPLGSYDAIMARPMFSPSRRGAAGAPTVVVSNNIDMKMKGSIIAGDVRIASFTPLAGGEEIRLREGEDYQGWILNEVGPHHAVFERSGEILRLEVDFKEVPVVAKKNRKRRAKRRRANDESEQESRAQRQDGNDEGAD